MIATCVSMWKMCFKVQRSFSSRDVFYFLFRNDNNFQLSFHCYVNIHIKTTFVLFSLA